MRLKPKSIMASTMAALALIGSAAAIGHAFPQREQPGVGSVVHEPPKRVRIWFDTKVEPAFSSLVVKDSRGNKISGKSKVDPESSQVLETNLPVLAPGDYHVYWKVVAWDGHHSEGDYIFTVKP